jgi:Na+-driven multidrug efflux pump
VICVGTVLLIPLSPALIFGWGPFPRLGVAGGAIAVLIFYGAGSLVLAAALRRPGSIVRLTLAGVRLRWALLWDILRVGAVAALITVQTNFTVVVVTGLVGTAGPEAIAGYGIGSRLEYMLVPLVFGLGAPLVAMVGTNIGAGRLARAQRVAWLGAALAGAVTEAIGLAAAIFPDAWIGLFSAEPAVIAAGSAYLRVAGPCYGFFGLGMALYFASQGAGRLTWPFLANLTRVCVATIGGWVVFGLLDGGLTGLFAMLAAALVLFGLINAGAVAAGSWTGARRG